MTLLTVAQQVCSFIGVARPQVLFPNVGSSRTAVELIDLATEMAQRIAHNTREWAKLKKQVTLVGNDLEAFPLPADYKRMLLTSNVWRSTSAIQPLRFIADADEWLQRRARGYNSAWGEWTILADGIHIWPIMSAHTSAIWKNSHAYRVGDLAVDPDVGTVPLNLVWQTAVAHTTLATGDFAAERLAHPSFWVQPAQDIDAVKATFAYLNKNCIALASGGFGDSFMNDGDTFALDERLLKLGMIWQWKAYKGSPYAEDMANYADALAVAQGADKPAPIIIGRTVVSASARVAYPYPIDPNMMPL